MKKIKISLSITALLYLIVTKNVNAAACSDVPSVGDYTVNEEDCYIGASQQVDGLDECLDGTASKNNTAVLTIANGASLTIPIGSTNTQTNLVTGSITIGDGSSISIGEYSTISIGAPLYMTDVDGDWYPASLVKTLTKTANTKRVCGMNIASVAKILAESDVDGDDNNSNVGACVPGTYYTDADGDGYGAGSVASTCLAAGTSGYATNNTDCDDAQSTVYTTHTACYWDMDSDSYTAGNTSGKTCLNNSSCNLATKGSLSGGVAPTTYTAGQLKNTANGNDCHETGTGANLVYVSATCYLDSDNDNYGKQGTTAKTCTNNATCASATAGSTGNSTAVSSSTNFSTTNDDCGINEANAFPGQTTYYGTTFTNSENDALVYDYNCDGTETKNTSPNLAYSCTPIAITYKGCDKYRHKCTGGAYSIGTWNNYSAATFSCGQTGCYSTGTYTHSCNCVWKPNKYNCVFSSCTEIYASSPTVQTCL